VMVAGSSIAMQSHKTFPLGVQTTSARWPIAKGGCVPMPITPGSYWRYEFEMSSRQRRQRCPSLSAWWNVLPLFFANEALPRRDNARRILGAAGGANKPVHLTAPGTCALCHWLYAIPLARGTGIATPTEELANVPARQGEHHRLSLARLF
jgi:hypothetical protein